ncbi:MAG: hypothetical protein P9M03_04035 [Candidatus Theseobacter exili]|nr:hypothetical protein [Candidatus Theseobacter exili]
MILAIAFFAASGYCQIHLNRMAPDEGITRRIIYRPADVVSNVLVAGFRGIAADILWLQIDELFHSGQHYKILPIFETITFLQPHFVLAWTTGGWHMAFNLYHEAITPEEKDKWLRSGIAYLLKGARNNPDRFDLFFDIGWTYFMKTDEYDKCIYYFSQAAQKEHPQWVEHMLAHSLEKAGRHKEAYDVWKNIQERGSSSSALARVVDRFVNRLGKIIDNDTELNTEEIVLEKNPQK